MDNLNYQFFEEFTKLDKTCVAVYQAEGGTLGYLAQMRSVSWFCSELVPHWTSDLEQLSRYRILYLALAQSPSAFAERLCSWEDVQWLRRFRNKIMERKDPLALLYLRGYRAEDDAMRRLEDGRSRETVSQAAGRRDRHRGGHFGVGVILVAVVLTCLICALLMTRI